MTLWASGLKSAAHADVMCDMNALGSLFGGGKKQGPPGELTCAWNKMKKVGGQKNGPIDFGTFWSQAGKNGEFADAATAATMWWFFDRDHDGTVTWHEWTAGFARVQRVAPGQEPDGSPRGSPAGLLAGAV